MLPRKEPHNSNTNTNTNNNNKQETRATPTTIFSIITQVYKAKLARNVGENESGTVKAKGMDS